MVPSTTFPKWISTESNCSMMLSIVSSPELVRFGTVPDQLVHHNLSILLAAYSFSNRSINSRMSQSGVLPPAATPTEPLSSSHQDPAPPRAPPRGGCPRILGDLRQLAGVGAVAAPDDQDAVHRGGQTAHRLLTGQRGPTDRIIYSNLRNPRHQSPHKIRKNPQFLGGLAQHADPLEGRVSSTRSSPSDSATTRAIPHVTQDALHLRMVPVPQDQHRVPFLGEGAGPGGVLDEGTGPVHHGTAPVRQATMHLRAHPVGSDERHRTLRGPRRGTPPREAPVAPAVPLPGGYGWDCRGRTLPDCPGGWFPAVRWPVVLRNAQTRGVGYGQFHVFGVCLPG